jgi:hypothetical protein
VELQSENLSEIGELLIKIGETLKSLPEKETGKEMIQGELPRTPRGDKRLTPAKRGDRIDTDIKVRRLAEELSYFGRSQAEEKLSLLSTKELGALCKLYEIPFRAKQTKKEELVRKILWHFFDFPAGRETIERLVIKQPEEITDFQEARAFFEANQEGLLDKYEGKYIAILKDEVMDADEDFSKLAERVYHRWGYRDIYMPKVEKRRAILNIPSPQLK